MVHAFSKTFSAFRPMRRAKQALSEKEIQLAGVAVLVFALVPEHVTGKRVHEA